MRKGLPVDWQDDWLGRRTKSKSAKLHLMAKSLGEKAVWLDKKKWVDAWTDKGTKLAAWTSTGHTLFSSPTSIYAATASTAATSSSTGSVFYTNATSGSGTITLSAQPATITVNVTGVPYGGTNVAYATQATNQAIQQLLQRQGNALQNQALQQLAGHHPQLGYGAGQYPGQPLTPAAAQMALQANQPMTPSQYQHLVNLANQGAAAVLGAAHQSVHGFRQPSEGYWGADVDPPDWEVPVIQLHGRYKVRDRSMFELEMPDGSVLRFKPDNNYDIKDDDAKITYQANRNRAFNKFLNTSDIVAEFIDYVGQLGVSKPDITQLPVELLIRFLIIRAAEQDGETVEERDRLTFEEMSRKVLRLPPPQATVDSGVKTLDAVAA